jgi:hypothetical protein
MALPRLKLFGIYNDVQAQSLVGLKRRIEDLQICGSSISAIHAADHTGEDGQEEIHVSISQLSLFTLPS